MPPLRTLPLVLLVSACASHTASTPRRSGDALHCEAPEIASVPRVPTLGLPAGCAVEAAGSLEAPLVVDTAETYAARVRCETGATPPAIDFATSSLYVARYTLTPAGVGIEVHDDGRVVTLARLEREPSPGDPMPMPMETLLAFVLPKGAPRTFRTLPCPVPPR